MTRIQRYLRLGLCAVVCAAAHGVLAAEQGAAPVGIVLEAGGSGSWPALAEARADLPLHTLYRPASLPDAALPLLIWGNGGCSANGLAHAGFLREIASHGYVVVALGSAQAPRAAAAAPAAAPAGDATDAAQMIEALEWATRITRAEADPLNGHIDVEHAAIAGHSCGGLQALKVSADERIDTSLIFNSGIYVRPGGRSGVAIDKSALAALHGPIAYFTGGADDIAHANAVDDVQRIEQVPVFFGWKPVGHGGTFAEPNGGAWAEVAVRWLDWQLKGAPANAAWFSGADCGLCTAADWTVERALQP
ncbi:MAG: hypothetical protein RLZZ227_473 [Pseudomonadota bacterium]|jgi:hypothetical protein